LGNRFVFFLFALGSIFLATLVGRCFGGGVFFGVTKAVGGMAWAFPLGCCLVSGYIFSEIDEDDDEMGEDVTNVLLFFFCMSSLELHVEGR
jgi:hypothetical protein